MGHLKRLHNSRIRARRIFWFDFPNIKHLFSQIVSYLLAIRVCIQKTIYILSHDIDLYEQNANPQTVGYVSSGYWGGITIGRFAWGHFTPK